ncbi:uncharacterized protein TRIVIDRAFT_218430 [Trichoderma virens Gv29-8]|uniref:GPI anchored protein n=1 Tax=Hypocrea virens (strain Gv29-8 / FGSC 10586) TaxID=413071 RepID=G9MHS4_HYPVG|nr:uncharacterized protein TRIVIDRAFT_218430 [Trichoderma virens Gv29-8]EHK26262.1 hypothetical protein TRIVIDRAFT_218430 [Trichoderma virens Gv29-8]UKZ46446.1 hypothetical protein TrVGV298_000649 [Trichoderma virens]
MTSLHKMLLLPAALLALVSEVAADQPLATAIKKQLPNPNEKLFPEHLAFEPLPQAPAFEAANLWLDDYDDEDASSNSTKRYRPAFSNHFHDSEENLLRRAADVLAILQNRAACPSGTESCSNIDAPNKCCPDGTYCTNVSGSDAGQVACCPNGVTCGGGVGNCPGDAVSCAADLGGGCCIPGYVCQGIGCVPSASATGIPTSTSPPPQSTTQTHTSVSSDSGTGTATGAAPWRPTDATSTSTSSSSSTTSASRLTTTQTDETQTGCPTGFYGCLATHGGGCCRTERDCQTLSCPAPSSTIISHGVTVVVPANDVPTTTASNECASGWFLCGKDAGSVAGCCPSGYKCGTASCFTSSASQTNSLQKQQPEPEAPNKNAATGSIPRSNWLALSGIAGSLVLILGIL